MCLCLILLLILPVAAPGAGQTIHFTVVFKNDQLPLNASQLIGEMGGKIVYSIPEIGVVQVQAPANFAQTALGKDFILSSTPSAFEKTPSMKLQKLEAASVTPDQAALFDQLALYSNYGPGLVDVAAPGGDYRIYLSLPPEEQQTAFEKEFCLSSIPLVEITYSSDGTVITGYNYLGPSYGFNIGTSMAAPKASAVAALIISKYGKMNPTQVKAWLQKSSLDLGRPGYDKYFGHGLVNAWQALTTK